MKFTSQQVDVIAATVVGKARPGMRRVIGDTTTEQYDKADQMAQYIANAVRESLIRLGYAEENK